MKQWHFYEKVFRRWTVLRIGTYQEFLDEMEASDYSERSELRDAKGMCVELTFENSSQYCCYVWLKEYESATLVHELTHLVMMQLDEVGVPISRENTEAFAFYTEYWWTQMQRARRKWPNGNKPSDAKL